MSGFEFDFDLIKALFACNAVVFRKKSNEEQVSAESQRNRAKDAI